MNGEPSFTEIARREEDAARRRFGLAWAIDGKHGETAREKAVTIDRDHVLLAAVHAADRDDAGECFTCRRFAWQMEIAGQGRLAERHFDFLDRVRRIFDELGVAGVHPRFVSVQRLVRFEDRPAG